ncbi:MAG: hypothetical protein ACM3S0_13055 [Acidobacteriota bacterium]
MDHPGQQTSSQPKYEPENRLAPSKTEINGVNVLVAPSPLLHGFIRFAQDPNHDREAVAFAQKALAAYADAVHAPDDYPLRIVHARNTGVPAFLTGVLDTVLDNPEAAGEMADHWLAGPHLSESLFGLPRDQAKPWLEQTGLVAQRDQSFDPNRTAAQRLHIHYQQVHGDFAVYGGEVMVHLRQNDTRAAVSSSYFPLRQVLDLTAPSDIELSKRRALDSALRVVAGMSDERLTWHARIAPYAGRELFVFPFAGNYYLAYNVELTSPSEDVGWRVFVQANTGTVLGAPENVLAHANIHRTATDPATLLTQAELDALSQPEIGAAGTIDPPIPAISRYIQWNLFDPAGLGAAIDLAAGDIGNATGPTLEAVSVAFHSRTLLKHFAWTCGASTSRLGFPGPNRIRIQVGKPGPNLDMGFNPASADPKLITFQSDTGNGLQDAHVVREPGFDPEVIYHELAHALMFLLNRDPFDLQQTSVPFGRALVEGYAMYFARSLAARSDSDHPGEHWARGAYAAWGDEWALAHTGGGTGDRLPAPNLYPDRSTGPTDFLPIYNVGMIWARALWDIRQALGNPDLVDRAALNAFNYVPGYVPSFESAAEGFVDSLSNSGDRATAIGLFADRGILADRGVRAVALANHAQVRLAGTDVGVLRFDAASGQWRQWSDGGILDIVALASDPQGSMVYAATEKGILRRDTINPGASWQSVDTWTFKETPLSLVFATPNLFVGTSRGVYVNNAPDGNGTWSRFEGGLAMEDLVVALATGDTVIHPAAGAPIPLTILFAANMGSPQRRPISAGVGWESAGAFPPNDPVITITIAADSINNTVYVGTLNHGIWRNAFTGTSAWNQDAAPITVGAVLDLCVANGTVYAATTTGLFERAGAAWQAVPGAPTGILTRVAASADASILLVGTAGQGLFVRSNNVWQAFSSIGE